MSKTKLVEVVFNPEKFAKLQGTFWVKDPADSHLVNCTLHNTTFVWDTGWDDEPCWQCWNECEVVIADGIATRKEGLKKEIEHLKDVKRDHSLCAEVRSGFLLEIKKLYEVLHRLEWITIGFATDPYCPLCKNYKSEGHKEDCWWVSSEKEEIEEKKEVI